MKPDPTLIKHRIAQLKHMRIISSSRFQFYQGFSLAGALMVIAAILFYLQQNNMVMLFVSYCILLVALVGFCIYAIYGHMHDKKINDKIEKNYGLLVGNDR